MQALALQRVSPDRQQFGRYRLLCHIASGGMAGIYLARRADDPFGKILVIKRIHDHMAEEAAFCRMLVDEARLSARLCHPSVVQVIELGSVHGTLFIAMEHVEGESLQALVRRVRLSYAHCARVAALAAAGLHHAHELRDSEGRPLEVVHRDVSPQNILISYEGEVKVADFGVAKARNNLQQTEPYMVKGNFAYMAPEQATARKVDRRTDVFALGIVLYEISTHRRLFRAANPAATVERLLHMQIPPPTRLMGDYPPRLEQIVMTALQGDPRRRFQSAGEMEDALSELVFASKDDELSPRASARSLARVMKRVFADRIALKQKLLQLGEESGDVVTDTTRLTASSPSLGTLDGTVLERPPRAKPRRRGRRCLLLGAVAAAAALLALLLVSLGSG